MKPYGRKGMSAHAQVKHEYWTRIYINQMILGLASFWLVLKWYTPFHVCNWTHVPRDEGETAKGKKYLSQYLDTMIWEPYCKVFSFAPTVET